MNLFMKFSIDMVREAWENDDYIWLQNAGEEYEKYRLTPYAEMNIAAEEMYQPRKRW